MYTLRRWWKWLVILSVGLLILAGCAAAPAPMLYGESGTSGNAKSDRAVQPAAAPPGPVAEQSTAADASLDVATTERMIVLTGSLSMVVKDASETIEQIKKISGELGGYIVNSNAYDDGEQVRGNINFRVPADKFYLALDLCKALAVRVQNETTNGQDVTEEYTDLSARLRNLEATEKELLELLGTIRQRSDKAEDILAVYRELTAIRAQIEQLKGRVQVLERLTAMSSIQVELIPDVSGKPISEPSWRPGDTLRSSFRILIDALQWLVDALIRLVVIVLPILAVVAIPIVALLLIVRWLARRRKGSAR